MTYLNDYLNDYPDVSFMFPATLVELPEHWGLFQDNYLIPGDQCHSSVIP